MNTFKSVLLNIVPYFNDNMWSYTIMIIEMYQHAHNLRLLVWKRLINRLYISKQQKVIRNNKILSTEKSF